jgi:Transglycosylase SLT domain
VQPSSSLPATTPPRPSPETTGSSTAGTPATTGEPRTEPGHATSGPSLQHSTQRDGDQPAADPSTGRSERLRRILKALSKREFRRKKKKRKRLLRWFRRAFVAGLALVLFLVVFSMAFEVPELRSTSGGTSGQLSGIPHAEAFNATATLGIDPRLVAAIAWVGSGFRPEVIDCTAPPGPGDKRGIMQLTPDVAQQFGIDPCVAAQAIDAGARHLVQLHERYGTWDLAISAYDVGAAALDAAGRVPPNPNYLGAVQDRWAELQVRFPSAGGLASAMATCPWRAEGSTDPVTTVNNTAATQQMANTLIACFGRNGYNVSCYEARAADPVYEHPRGRACDFMITAYRGRAEGHERARGQAMAEFAAAHAAEFKILYVIWFERSWSPSDGQIPWEQWDRYSGSNPHTDHVHVSVHLQPGDPPLAHCLPQYSCTE